MGPNNDLVKFAKALGIDLKPSTVEGQVLNATLLEPIKVSVAIAQAVLGGVEDLERNLEREVARAGENIGRELSKGGW